MVAAQLWNDLLRPYHARESLNPSDDSRSLIARSCSFNVWPIVVVGIITEVSPIRGLHGYAIALGRLRLRCRSPVLAGRPKYWQTRLRWPYGFFQVRHPLRQEAAQFAAAVAFGHFEEPGVCYALGFPCGPVGGACLGMNARCVKNFVYALARPACVPPCQPSAAPELWRTQPAAQFQA